MASDYGLNFGFMRSDESIRWTEGRFRTPAASSLVLGTLVEINPAAPGELKQSAANAVPLAGYCGLLLQELDWDRSIYESPADQLDSFQLGVAKAARLSIITGGAGVKFWIANTASQTRADGRAISARTMHSGTPAVGDSLYWTGTAFAKVSSSQPAVAKVVHVPSASRVEAVLLG